jgi:AAA15 family ATPase/GTPase
MSRLKFEIPYYHSITEIIERLVNFMSTSLTPVSIAAVPEQGIPAFAATVERVNVILGANGVGKPKLLQHLVGNS